MSVSGIVKDVWGWPLRIIVGELREFVRFVATGGVATIGNMVVVWIARGYLPAALSFVLGLTAGMCLSYLLMKVFAFRSHDWSAGWREVARFLLVYLIGSSAYIATAVTAERLLSAMTVSPRLAALGGVLSGGVVMAVTSYLGHRHYTYKHAQHDEIGGE